MNELEHFIQQLDAPDFSSRRQAAEILGQLDIPEAVPFLMTHLGDPSWQVRSSIQQALVNLAKYIDRQELVQHLFSENIEERNAAISIMTELGEVMLPELEKCLRANDADVRILSANALGFLQADAAIPYLVKALHDEDENVQYAAVEALGRIGSQEATTALLTFLNHSDPWQVYPAVVALGEIGDAQAIYALMDKLSDDILCLPAIEALGRLGLANPIPQLMDKILDEDEDIQLAAINAIANIYFAYEAPDNPKTFFGRKNPAIRELEKAVSPAFSRRLHQIFVQQSNNIDIIRNLLTFFQIVPFEGSLFELTCYLEHEKTASLAESLFIKNAQGKRPDHFVELLDSQPPEIQIPILHLLGTLEKGQSYQALQKYLQHPNEEIVAAAATSAGFLGCSRLVPTLFQLIHTENLELLEAIAGALALIGTEQVQAQCLELLQKPIPQLQTNILYVLRIIGDPSIATQVLPFLRCEEQNLQTQALEYFATISFCYNEQEKQQMLSDIYDDLEWLSLNGKPQVKKALLHFLFRYQDPSLDNLLLYLTQKEHDIWTRYTALQNIDKIAHPNEAISVIDQILVDDDVSPLLKIAAVRCADRLASPHLSNWLALLLEKHQHDREVLVEVIKSIGNHHLETFSSVLKSMLSPMKNDWEIFRQLVHTLIRLNCQDMIPDLLTLTQNDEITSYYGIKAMLKAFVHFHASDAIPFILAWAKKPKLAPLVLDALLDSNHFSLLKNYIHFPHAPIRAMLCYVFSQAEENQGREPLAQLLIDKHPQVRLAAVWAVENLRDTFFARQLMNLVKTEPDPLIKNAILHCINVLAKKRISQ